MKQALLFAADIKRMRAAIETTSSEYLIRDYKKAIKRKTKELKYYCACRGLDFEDVMRGD